MNNSKRILATIFLCIFIFTLNISEAKSYNLNNKESKSSEISKFIPEDNEILFYSNYKNNEINRFINQKFTNNEIKKINIIKNSLISFLGFNIKDNFNNIFDGEFILSTFKKTNKKREILIIFKSKKESNLNKILNIEDNNSNINQIIEISRPKTLNLMTHIIQTNDNYIICATNKDLIYDSLKAFNNKKLKQNRKEKFKYYENQLTNKKLFLYINKQFFDFINLKPLNIKKMNYLTQFYFDNNKLLLNSFSMNNQDKVLDKNNLNIVEKNDILLQANDLNIFKDLVQNSVKDVIFNELFENISKKIKDKILIAINNNNNNWIIGFKNPKNNFSITQLTSLNNFHKDKFKNDNNTYIVFSKNNLEFLDQKIIYKSEPPIFLYESNNLSFISNNLSELLSKLNSLIAENIMQEEPRNLIIDDKLIIKNFSNEIYKDFLNIFDSLNYFTANGLSLTLETFESKTTQKIPEIIPSIQLKTHIKLT